ncbi:hypothetical protein PVAND_005256 [Polypedilum vanderplanki]|uniref:Uncharacterized protein n=1 Tax=Polypedilum vanderplanki TaxID=319348 RepID=A0A9J6C015_POLVA|nr:hypothetical protein PVAND_005256 [Polypedilum vanderplanki]
MCESEDDIVISGISGRFPKSRNVQEFCKNLYGKVDMTCDKEDRWKHVFPNVPPRFGKITDIEKFDAPFFSMLKKHAEWTDPQMRMLLEHSYEAILDAGISPQSLMGSKTAVLVGVVSSDSKDYFSKNILPTYHGYRVVGHALCYLANRVSYLFGLTGPSMVIDTACSSSACALDMAYYYLKSGVCDAAIVGGLQLNLNTTTFTEYTGLGILSPDGIPRPYDEDATGFTRAESICSVFLQKRKDSKRIYAQLVHSLSNNDGFKIEGQSLPSREMQVKLMDDFYQKVNVDIRDVKFIEAHATGTKKGDPLEVSAIDEVLCKNREDPLIIGTVKSNMGHAEAASGVVSITKIALAFENDQFPPNINITKMRTDIEAFNEGRIKVATDSLPIDSDYIAFNSFGLGGSNVHALFKRNSKIKVNHGLPKDSLERLVLWSGRTEEALNTIFDDITSRPLDAEHIALLQNTQIMTPDANSYRGFGIFKKNNFDNAISVQKSMQLFDGIRRPIVFCYSGMGTQWHGMGQDLMEIPVFAESIEKCHKILEEKCENFDLKGLLNSKDEESFNDILNAYLGIISIEIALTDLLNALGIKPTFIIGHSVGEIGCSYADGCFTTEEALMIAFKRGKINKEANIIEGAMAAVGMHYKELEDLLPPMIDIACHNSIQSTTISGPKDAVEEFVAKLKKDGIFANTIACAGIPFHSRYISKVGQEMSKSFEECIKQPKLRSSKWISSTYSEDQWMENEAKFCGAQYQAKNALNPVLFEEAATKLPKNAIVIEVSSNGILKSIMKSLLSNCSYVRLSTKHKPGKLSILETLGNLFQFGVDMNVAAIYPAIKFPVSRGTPMISPKIKWNHSENHFVAYFDAKYELERFSMILNFDSEEFSFLKDHVIDGKMIIPGAFYIYIIWKLFALMNSTDLNKMKITIKDIELARMTRVLSNEEVIITISVHRGTGNFEISEGNMMVVKGKIFRDDDLVIKRVVPTKLSPDILILPKEDFYRYGRSRGYQFGESFHDVKSVVYDGSEAKIIWRNNWTTFIDATLQPLALNDDSMEVAVPFKIDEISIDPIMHLKMAKEQEQNEEIIFDYQICKGSDKTTCGGIRMKRFKGIRIARQSQKKPVFESQKFVPFVSDIPQSFGQNDVLKIFLTHFSESNIKHTYSIVEINEKQSDHVLVHLSKVLDEFLMKFDLKLLTSTEMEIENIQVTSDNDLKKFIRNNRNADIVIKDNCVNDYEFLRIAKENFNDDIVYISREVSDQNINKEEISVISKINLQNDKSFIMFKNKSTQKEESKSYKCIEITKKTSEWLNKLQKIAQDEESKEQVIIYSQNLQSGLLGFYNCLRFEFPMNKKITCVLIDDNDAPKFDPTNLFYAKQLEKGFAVNIFREGTWGAQRHINIIPDTSLTPQTGHCFANYSKKGQLSSLKWREGKLNQKLDKKENLIAIHYSSLNFKDVLYAHGYISDDTSLTKECAIGFEFSGIHLGTGERVMGLSNKTGCISTLYDPSDASILIPIPDHWTLEEAATIPSVYITVYYSFFQATKIKKGKSILIHSGSGGVGQAALNVAFAYGLEVFTTVGSEEKKNFLLKNYPKLKSENIGNSRDTTFIDMIMERTNEKGVDYVLNSLSDDKMIESINCLKKGGVFLEIGRADILKGTTINLDFLGNDIEMKSIRIDHLQQKEGSLSEIIKILKHDMKAGIIKPINYTIFEASEIVKAFQFMASGHHIGKVLIKIRDDNTQSLPLNVKPRFYCKSECSYIICGGLGGLGLEFSQWLVSRGCRKLVLSSSRGISNQYQAYKIQLWKKYGVEVIISTANIATLEGCLKLINEAQTLGPVDTIFNFAAVLQDGIFTNQTEKMFKKSLEPKAVATKYLHEASLDLCPNLQHFVVFSSISCGRGKGGQTNYGMANSIMEEIVQMRHNMKLPAKAIQWGPISEVGMLSEGETPILMVGYQSLLSVLESLDILLLHPDPIVASTVFLDKNIQSDEKLGLIDMLMKLLNIEDRKTISMNSTFSQLGIDSLAGVEMQQLIEREYGVTLSAKELRTLSLAELEMRVTSGKEVSKKDGVKINKELSLARLFFEYYRVEDLLGFVTSTSLFMKANNIVRNDGRKILFVPGIEGVTYQQLDKIAANLKLPMYVMQYFLIKHEPELEDLCEKIIPSVIEFFNNSPDFILVCYSFGTLLGLKLAKALENTGKSGQLIEIDGSPQVIYHYSISLNPERSEKKNHEVLLKTFKQYFQVENDDNIDSIPKLMDAAFPNHNDNYKIFFEFLLNRLKMLFTLNEVNFEALERTKITLIRATESEITGIYNDFGLTKYSKESVDIKTMKGDHISLISKPELIDVIKEVIV